MLNLEGENVVFRTRPHIIGLLSTLFLYALFLLAIIIASPMLIHLAQNKLHIHIPTWWLLIYFACIIFLGFQIFASIYNWLNDLYVLTDKRLIDYNRTLPFRETIVETSLNEIQNVYVNKAGPLQVIFKFGNLIVETAAESTRLVWENIPNVTEIQRQIMRAKEGANGVQREN